MIHALHELMAIAAGAVRPQRPLAQLRLAGYRDFREVRRKRHWANR